MSGFDLAQTFFLDKDAVQGADIASITGVDLYIYKKPTAGKTKSGINKPGISVFLCGCKEDGSPDLTLFHHTFSARVEHDNVAADTDGGDPTSFVFNQPLPAPTDRKYAILIKFDGSDPDFKIWYNKAGENVLGTTTKTSVSSGKVDGSLFTMTNGKTLTPVVDADLSFRLKVAKHTATTMTFLVKNRPYELISFSDKTGIFKGGEDVYKVSANATGTVSINASSTSLIGTGTNFSTLNAGDAFVITDGTAENTEVRIVASRSNTTLLTLTEPPSFTNASGKYYKTATAKMFYADGISDNMVLNDSTANDSVYFANGDVIKGVDSLASATITAITDYQLNSVVPNYAIKTPGGTVATATINFANNGGSMSPSTQLDATLGQRMFINKYDAVITSQTNRALSGDPDPFAGTLTFTTNNPYVSPYVREENLDLFVERYSINNVSTNEYKGTGSAQARYITRTVDLADQVSEDMKLYLRGYRPSGTTIEAYARFHNSEDPESIDLKDWTQLSFVGTDVPFSSPSNIYDFKELPFAVPNYGTGTTATGTFTVSSACTVITGTSGTVSTNVPVGSSVRVYSTTFPDNYFVDTVVAANATTITVATGPGSNASILGSGFKVDVLSRPQSAFLDVQSGSVLTYFNKAGAVFRGYDKFAVKLILLSSDGIRIPYVDDVRAIAVSA